MFVLYFTNKQECLDYHRDSLLIRCTAPNPWESHSARNHYENNINNNISMFTAFLFPFSAAYLYIHWNTFRQFR